MKSYMRLLVLLILICFIVVLLFVYNNSLRLSHHYDSFTKAFPTIHVITPTYARPVQVAELTRLCHTFSLVPHIHWIVVEDAKATSRIVSDLLRGVDCNRITRITLLHAITPPEIVAARNLTVRWKVPRGSAQRNQGLWWLRNSLDTFIETDDVVYFADDDNTYSLQLFDEMRFTRRKMSVWPVGLVGRVLVERPIVANGYVVGWDVQWGRKRPFAIDMAGFAVRLDLVLRMTYAIFPAGLAVRVGYQESEWLSSLGIELFDLEPKADLCRNVLVWHTRSQRVDLGLEKSLKLKTHNDSNPINFEL